MNYTETATPTICAAEGKELKCVSQRDQIWDGNSHGDYNPMCTNSNESYVADSLVAPVPPRVEYECTNFDTFVDNMSYGYTKVALTNKTTLLYKINYQNELDLKMIYDSKVGWMKLGIYI